MKQDFWVRLRSGLLLGTGCLALGSACVQRNEPGPAGAAIAPHVASSEIVTAAVEEQTIGKSIVTSARIVFDENRVAHVFSPVTGRVTKIVAQLGQQVHRGDVLAVIASPDMGNAYSDVNKAKPNVVQTQKELARQKELYAAHAGPLRDLEAAQSNYDQAEAELQRAMEKLRLLQEQAHSEAVSQVFSLVAPIDGEITARQINPGSEVQGQYSGGATQELYTLGRQDALWVLADVYEQDMGRVKIGAPIEVRTVAYPDKVFTGKVDWISGTLDPMMRTMTVRCTLDNPESLLKAQMYATVSIAAEGYKALAIPRTALLHFGQKTMVMAVNAQRDSYERIPVIADEDGTGDWVPVLHGLQAGEQIVTSGALLVSETVR